MLSKTDQGPSKDKRLETIEEMPLVIQTPVHLLDADTTPTSRFFIRNNGQVPDIAGENDDWRLKIEGEVETPLDLSVAELKTRFETVSLHMVLECGGNGRTFFQPAPKGTPWKHGGVGCAEWTGVRLADVLSAAGVKESGIYTAHYGADAVVPGSNDAEALSRGMRIEKAREPHTLLAFGMNGEPLPLAHGGPLRLVVPGWPGSLSQKWLNRILIRDREHDGKGMLGTSYRMPRRPLIPGGAHEGVPFDVLESMPVRSIITAPAHGRRYSPATREILLRGAAWAGDEEIDRVDVSKDNGATWIAAELDPPRNRYDWVRWNASVPFETDGYYELVARATTKAGIAQPFVPNNWNPGGYACNAMHRIAILIG